MLIRTIDQFTNNTFVSPNEIGFTDDVFPCWDELRMKCRERDIHAG